MACGLKLSRVANHKICTSRERFVRGRSGIDASHRWVGPLCPNILSNRKIEERSLLVASWKQGVAGYGWVDDKDRHTKGSATLSIAALGMATAYLLLVAAGAIGALLVLLWLFGEDMSCTTEDIERDKFESAQSAGRLGSIGTHSAPVEPERWEDEAA